MTIKLYIDHRESKVIDTINSVFSLPPTFANRGNVELEVKQLNIGDYVIVNESYKDGEINETVLAVIERKTLKDYSASMKDGRHHNKNKLINLRDKTKCNIFYLVEGPKSPNNNTYYCGIPYRNIKASITHLQILDNIQVERSKNIQETAEWLKFMCESYEGLIISNKLDQPIIESGNPDESSESSDSVKSLTFDQIEKKCQFTPEMKMQKQILKIWTSIPGIGENNGSILAKQFTLKNLINGEIPTLVNLNNFKINNKKPGPKIMELLKRSDTSNMDFSEIDRKMFLSFPGIGKSNSVLIEKYTLREIINPEMKDEISKFKHTEKGASFGKKRIESILSLVELLL